MPFSEDEEILFGLKTDIHTHQKSLVVAAKLFSIREDLERNVTSLKTLTWSNFSRRTTLKSNLTKNVERFATEQNRSIALHPFEGDYRVDFFLLACITLTETAYTILEEHRLGPKFPKFCTRVVTRIEINQQLRKRLIGKVEEICRRLHRPEKAMLLGIGSDVEGSPSTVQVPLNSPALVPSRSTIGPTTKSKEYLH
jgi:hypothetical protein